MNSQRRLRLRKSLSDRHGSKLEFGRWPTKMRIGDSADGQLR